MARWFYEGTLLNSVLEQIQTYIANGKFPIFRISPGKHKEAKRTESALTAMFMDLRHETPICAITFLWEGPNAFQEMCNIGPDRLPAQTYLIFLLAARIGYIALDSFDNNTPHKLMHTNAARALLASQVDSYYFDQFQLHNSQDQQLRDIEERNNNRVKAVALSLNNEIIHHLNHISKQKALANPESAVDSFVTSLETLWTEEGLQYLTSLYQDSFNRHKSLIEDPELLDRETMLAASAAHFFASMYKIITTPKENRVQFRPRKGLHYSLAINSEQSHIFAASIYFGIRLGGTLNHKEYDFIYCTDLIQNHHQNDYYTKPWLALHSSEPVIGIPSLNDAEVSFASSYIATPQMAGVTENQRILAFEFEQMNIEQARIAGEKYGHEHGEFIITKVPRHFGKIAECHHLRVNIQGNGIWCTVVFNTDPVKFITGFWSPNQLDSFFLLTSSEVRYSLVQLCAGIWQDAHTVEEIYRTLTNTHGKQPPSARLSEAKKSLVYLPRRIYHLQWGTEKEISHIENLLDNVAKTPHSRRPHYRRLPEGWQKGPDADSKAIAAGFLPCPPKKTFIPGYLVGDTPLSPPELICKGLLTASIGISGLLAETHSDTKPQSSPANSE